MSQIECPQCKALLSNMSNFCSMCGCNIDNEKSLEIINDSDFSVAYPDINESTRSKLTEMSVALKKNTITRNFELSKYGELYENELQIFKKQLDLKERISTEKLNYEYKKYSTFLKKKFLESLDIQNQEFLEALTKCMESIVETKMQNEEKILKKSEWSEKNRNETTDLIKKSKRAFQKCASKIVDSLDETITYEKI